MKLPKVIYVKVEDDQRQEAWLHAVGFYELKSTRRLKKVVEEVR